MMKVGTKGQFMIVSLLATVMTIFAFVALYPVMKAQIDNAVSDVHCTNTTIIGGSGTSVCGMDVYTSTLLELTPFFILIAIILTIVFASLPMKEVG
jgi:hypothetical protein